MAHRVSLKRQALGAVLLCVALAGFLFWRTGVLRAQSKQPVWTAEQRPLANQIARLRSLPDDARGKATQDLAIQIRSLPASTNKLLLAYHLATLATEGDPGGDSTLQDVATTLADALAEVHPAPSGDRPSPPYTELAKLVRYEHVQASSESPQYATAMAKLEAEDTHLQRVDFTLADMDGKTWSMSELRGKVVLVNFWATWCPPCRKEMPDLQALGQRFNDQDLVILGISDENAETVRGFVSQGNYTYPILLDPERKVARQFEIDSLPKSFVYDRDGNLVAQSIDMRTEQGFLDMLAKAGLQ